MFFSEEINMIVSSSIDDKRMETVYSIDTYAYGTSKYLVNEKEKTVNWNWLQFQIVHTEY